MCAHITNSTITITLPPPTVTIIDTAAAAAAAAAEARFVAEDPATFTSFKADYDRSRTTLTRTGAL
jgi:hypothetical protein